MQCECLARAKPSERTTLPGAPGRLGDDSLTPTTDPRTDPRMLEALVKYNAAGRMNSGIPLSTPSFLLHWLFKLGESSKEKLADSAVADMPKIGGITESVETIKGVDDNDIKLFIAAPEGLSQPSPCVIHFHGGGMVIFDPEVGCYRRWRQELASRGLVCVSVGFRNGSGNHNARAPFPAGLNDCVSAIKWVDANKSMLQVNKVLTHGESGGGNLSISSAVKAASQGIKVEGVYASCAVLSNCYDTSPEYGKLFPSMVENDGYAVDVAGLHLTSRLYTEVGTPDARDGLAWPYHASDDQLKQLPKTVISVNELDPLRDEGLALAGRIKKLGVGGYSRVVKGATHAAEVSYQNEVKDIAAATLNDITVFAKSL